MMIQKSLKLSDGSTVPARRVSTLVVGSGAAGLNAAVQLHSSGETDMAVYTEGRKSGTSINTGSDKQTYYKLGMYGAEPDSPSDMARSLFDGGSTHGDIALVESALSPRAFFNLVNIGVPFPTDSFGQFVGYKTDHDPSRRATSVGPRTSRIMCERLLDELKRRGIELVEKRVAVSLITVNIGNSKRACGAVFAVTDANSPDDMLEVVFADNVIFAVGGPGGLYSKSVYPKGHTGAIGLALMEGAETANLAESQYGIASVKFRWNVSGTYMQVVPRFVSIDSDGVEREFLRPFFDSPGAMNSAVFLKGYQWPFDPSKARGGSSLIDLLVYRETEKLGRRVYLDFRSDPADFTFDALSEEAKSYLANSDATFESPIERLRAMNPEAIELYSAHNIDITTEPLEVAVCAQHNNGGLAADIWWESVNISCLFPIGEVNGSHGVRRPGGAALNSGQVAGFRVAELITKTRGTREFPEEAAVAEAVKRIDDISIDLRSEALGDWREIRAEIASRMSESAALLRSEQALVDASENAWGLFAKLADSGVMPGNPGTTALVEGLRNRQLCFAHAVYLETILFAVRSGVGSRGSAMVLTTDGFETHRALGAEWNFAPENEAFKNKILASRALAPRKVQCCWIERRPIPETNAWFETAWRDFRENAHLSPFSGKKP